MDQPTVTHADYVVVGAGSAGAIVARRLADSGASVVLIEAGKVDKTRFVRKPGLIAVFHNIPRLKKTLDWGFSTVPQENALGRRIPQTRGKVLGGSSSINGMLFVRGNKKNFDDWALDGCKGWGWDDVLPAYKKLENWEGGASDVRGAGGPVQVTRVKDVTDASQSFMTAMSDTAGVPVIDDYNGHTQEGVSLFQQSAAKGLRYSSSVSYLDAHGLGHLTVLANTLATRVVIENGRATGVEIREGRATRVVRADREVVLSAGAYQSPQLLQLSGIGPADHLRGHGIPVHADLPVGDNLHDHMFVPMTFEMPSARNRSSASYFAKGVLAGVHPRQQLGGADRVRGLRVRPLLAGERRARHPDPRAALGLPGPQPGRTDPARGAARPRADRVLDADLPAQPRHGAARVGGPDRGAR